MISLYIQINIFLAASWVLFQLLPKRRLPYRASKKIAQALVVISIVAVPVTAVLPDLSFPKLTSNVEVMSGQDIDTDASVLAPMQRAAKQVALVVEATPKPSGPFASLWFWIFVFGMFVMIVRRLTSWYRLFKLLRSTLTLHKIGRTSVVVSDLIVVPFSALNLRRAYVVLPSSLVPYRTEFKIALRHEIEHHRRRDTLWAVMLEWLICGFYLNPAIYLWRKTILQLQELACDEALIGRMRISKQAYGSCLLKVAEMALDRRFICAGTTCMIPTSESNSHSFLRRRINMLAQHERSTARRASAFALGTLSSFSIVAAAYVAQAAVRSDGSPNPGKPIFDSRIQPLAEEALKKGMALHQASAGFAIVADPVRGTVIAAVSLNDGFDKKLKGDWALSYPLQPGSVLKPLIVASALQKKVTKNGEMHDCEKGQYRFGKNIYNESTSFDKLSTADTVVQSSNICTIKISQKLGAKGLENALREFGIGKDGSAAGFPSATVGFVPMAGTIPDENYIALVSHGISNRTDLYVTPLEMVEAYGAIANGGKLMKAIGADAKQPPETIRDVLSPEVSAQVREALRRAVEEGTGKPIKGSSISLAGKTSTVVLNGNQRITGFIGYAPADKPKLIVYVALFDPKGTGKYGSTTAAPVFREIIEKTVPIYNP